VIQYQINSIWSKFGPNFPTRYQIPHPRFAPGLSSYGHSMEEVSPTGNQRVPKRPPVTKRKATGMIHRLSHILWLFCIAIVFGAYLLNGFGRTYAHVLRLRSDVVGTVHWEPCKNGMECGSIM
jgi:hypothetical protein